jgi:hypothetical protein
MSTPSISEFLRLSASDRQFILMGLSWIGANYHLWRSKGRYPNSRPDLVWARDIDRGVYDQEFMDRTLALHATIVALKAGGRLRVATPMEFAACALAVRVAVTRHRHGHQLLEIAKTDVSSAGLLRRIESARKRAKRAEIRLLGAAGYQLSAKAWRDFATWLRVHLLDCKCKWKRRNRPVMSGRLIVKQLVDWTKAELFDRKEQVPSERELHRLVRLALRYIRRGRTNFCVGEYMNDKVLASSRLATFITIRLEKRSKFKNNK